VVLESLSLLKIVIFVNKNFSLFENLILHELKFPKQSPTQICDLCHQQDNYTIFYVTSRLFIIYTTKV